MYAAMACFGVLALVLKGYPDWYAFAVLGLAGMVLFGGVSGLQHLGFSFNAGLRKRSYSTVRQWPISQIGGSECGSGQRVAVVAVVFARTVFSLAGIESERGVGAVHAGRGGGVLPAG